MLAELAPSLLDLQLRDPHSLYDLEDTVYELENQEITREQALEQISKISEQFLRKIDHTEDRTSLLVLADYNSEYSDTEMAKEIAKYLFSKTNQSHFTWRMAASDKYGSYSHQWIGFREGEQVRLVSSDEYCEKQFSVLASA